jgi:hypothetical protein
MRFDYEFTMIDFVRVLRFELRAQLELEQQNKARLELEPRLKINDSNLDSLGSLKLSSFTPLLANTLTPPK